MKHNACQTKTYPALSGQHQGRHHRGRAQGNAPRRRPAEPTAIDVAARRWAGEGSRG
jgi:hypothetical protein